MRGVDIVLKALLMIFLMISISFMTSDLSFVSADETENNVCCEQTLSGDSCLYTGESNCDSSYLQSSTACEQTAFCKPGCCISDEGKCSKSVGKSTCENIDGYSWSEGADCSTVDACEKNCCVIAESQCSYTTEANCEILIQDLEDITLDWRDVDSESSCTDICQASDRGCCVSSDSCTYGTQAECESPDIDLSEGYGFYKDSICSEHGQCGCIAHDYKQCVDEDVYWFDSCGNQETVVARNDIDSNGEVATEDGNCDYTDGTWCGTEGDEVSCLSTDCDTEEGTNPDTGAAAYTFDGWYYTDPEKPGEIAEQGYDRNPHDSGVGGVRKNGESWCLYESPAGAFKDFPGSQHYRSFCYFGEEILEPCADYREEVCIQVPYDVYGEKDEFGFWANSDSQDSDYTGPTGSACVDNTDNEVFSPEVTTVAVGNDWDDESLVDTCAQANVECKMSYAKDSWTDPNYQAGQGVMCTSPQWALATHEYCRSQGDCGNSMNLVGDFSSNGFYLTPSQEFLTAEDENNKSNKVYIGYDSCVDHFVKKPDVGSKEGNRLGYSSWAGATGEKEYTDQIDAVNNYEQEAVFCLYDCDESTGGCDFIETVDEDFYKYYYEPELVDIGLLPGVQGNKVIDISTRANYQKLSVADPDNDKLIDTSAGWPERYFSDDLGQTSYGVYGGLVAISNIYYDNVGLGDVRTYGWVLAMSITSVLGGVLGAGIFAAAAAGTATGSGLAGFAASSSALLTNTALTASTSSVVVGQSSSVIITQEVTTVTSTTTASVAGIALIWIAALIVIATTLWQAGEVASIYNPLEREKATETFAISSGIAAGLSALLLIAAFASGAGPVGWVVAAVALLVAGVAALLSVGGQVRDVSIQSHCEAWQPSTGSDYCELCDLPVSEGGLAIDDNLGNILTGYECTEYKCKSLGMGCEYISENQGTDRPKCIGVDVDDVNRPIIEKYMLDVSDDMNDLGLEDSYSEDTGSWYTSQDGSNVDFQTNDGTDNGYLKIDSDQIMVWPYQYVTFGFETDEPSQCKISQSVPESYDDMDLDFPDSYFDYQHNQSWILVPDTLYTFYIVCQDHNGNGASPPTFFEVQLETDEGDDVTPPQIETTSVHNGAYVAAGVNETALSIYLDDAVEGCRWSTLDQDYSLMEWPFICPGVPDSASAYFDNDCSTVLNVTETTNYYYFACIDASGNAMTENYPFTLLSTGPLFIDSTSPTGNLYYDYTTLAVQTSGGAEEGKAICSYDGIDFYQTNSSLHQQPLEDLGTGEYNYSISCMDVAGNTNTTTIGFTIAVDTASPTLLELYKSETTVYFTLDETATCEYYYEDFSYGGGTSVSGSFALTDVDHYYLKCQDTFGNEGDWEIHV